MNIMAVIATILLYLLMMTLWVTFKPKRFYFADGVLFLLLLLLIKESPFFLSLGTILASIFVGVFTWQLGKRQLWAIPVAVILLVWYTSVGGWNWAVAW